MAEAASREKFRLGLESVALDNLDLNSVLGPLEGQNRFGRGGGIGAGGGRGVDLATLPGNTRAAQQEALRLQEGGASASCGHRGPSAQHSLAHGPAMAGGRCGERLQFTVTVVSEDGRICEGGGVLVNAKVTGLSLISKVFPEPRPWIEDKRDGTHVVQFVCATPGEYELSAFIESVQLPMFPVTMTITPGPASAMHCDLTGNGTLVCKSGSRSEFTIVARDEFGNECGVGGHRFGVRVVGQAKLHEVVDNEDGTYIVCFSLPEWSQGPIQLEVLLDGVPVKGSPVRPTVQAVSAKKEVPLTLEDDDAATLEAQVQRLQWLRENPPYEIPEMPRVPQIAWGATSPRGAGGFGGGATSPGLGNSPRGGDGALGTALGASGTSGDAAAARLAWRAADEWRLLGEMREEMSRCRTALLEQQRALVTVGEAVHRQHLKVKESRQLLQSERDQLGQVEARLEWMRRDLSPRAVAGASSVPSVQSPPARATSSRSNSPGRIRFDETLLPENQLAASTASTSRLPRGGMSPPKSTLAAGSSISPIYAPPPPEEASLFQSGGGVNGRINQVQPPPVPPPFITDDGRSLASPPQRFEPAEELSPQAAPFSGTPRRGGGLLRDPPPPPSPPPAIDTSVAAGGTQGVSTEELNQAMRKLFFTFASRTIGAASNTPRGGNSAGGRVGMGLQDYRRLTRAAQLRLATTEVEEAFQQTVKRYGSSVSADGERTLSYELFVELLLETARKRYRGLSDAESTVALFEEHMLPLSWQLGSG
eukprot:TRINITY_DN38326_c0_g1_i1.p1 TRINITY_DN38326_c0_g1~~TRINITY_DN38326_c0_g1_i1.p1  ORF type:complete len:786 (-),score=154.78 TRINITY_DN38326_c0_g1_i1:60-2351(-)